MFTAGRSHFGVFAIVRGIVAAHDALQFWKFTHHVGEQIGFG
jgi:hypothetical protein